MKKFLSIAAYLLFVGIVLQSCGNRTSIAELRRLCNRLETKSQNFTADDWNEAMADFENITNRLSDKSDYTDEEIREIGRLEGRCTAIFMEHAFLELDETIDDAIIEFGGFSEGLSEEIDAFDD